MAKEKKKKPFDDYLKLDPEMTKKTIRAPIDLWDRVDALAKKEGKSLNTVMVAALEKVCDEEGV